MYNKYMFENLFPEKFYHAYLVEGDPTVTHLNLKDYLMSLESFRPDNTDIFIETYDALDMDQSGVIKEWHTLASSSGGSRLCIIGTKNINREAEQSLLKILEEPGEKTHFFIVVPDVSVVLPTILSRCHTIKIAKMDKYESWVAKYLSSNPSGRLDMVGSLIKEFDDVEGSAALRHEAKLILNSLEIYLFKKYKKDPKDNAKLSDTIEEIIKLKKYLRNPGSSVKMILEHVSLVV